MRAMRVRGALTRGIGIMQFRTAYVSDDGVDPVANARRAASKIQIAFSDFPVSMVLFFAATNYEPTVLAEAMRDAFPHAKTFGCTTAGESVDDRILGGSVVAMAFSAEAFDYNELALVTANAPADPERGVFSDAGEAMRHLGRKLGHDMIKLDYKEYVGFMLADRISNFSEAVLEKVGEMTDVIFVGGFAGDDYKFTDGQRVFFNGASHASACVLALWKPKNGFSLLKTQAVEMTDKHLVITKADEDNRVIWQFNGEEAARAYARAAGLSATDMGILDFDENPLAVTADGEPYLRAIVKRVDGGGLQMFARVREGTRQTVTKAGDVLGTTRLEFEEKRRELENISAILHVNCASRHTALKKCNQVDAFAKLFAGIPGVGFMSYGEIYVGLVALTSTMILFK